MVCGPFHEEELCDLCQVACMEESDDVGTVAVRCVCHVLLGMLCQTICAMPSQCFCTELAMRMQKLIYNVFLH